MLTTPTGDTPTNQPQECFAAVSARETSAVMDSVIIKRIEAACEKSHVISHMTPVTQRMRYS